jgi:hypothetical protein
MKVEESRFLKFVLLYYLFFFVIDVIMYFSGVMHDTRLLISAPLILLIGVGAHFFARGSSKGRYLAYASLALLILITVYSNITAPKENPYNDWIGVIILAGLLYEVEKRVKEREKNKR